MILYCGCTASPASAYQDKKYGEGNRVHNRYEREGGGWRCTLCKTDRQAPRPKAREED